MGKFRDNSKQRCLGKRVWTGAVLILLLFLMPVRILAQQESSTAYRLEVTPGMKTFHIPYKELTFGDCFRIVSRNAIKWNWNGEPEYRGKLSGNAGTTGYLESIPLPEGTVPGEYRFDLMIGASRGGTTCYSEALSMVVIVRELEDVVWDTICSGEHLTYIPECLKAGSAVPADYVWQRSSVDGIREPANSGVGMIDEVLTNVTYKPIEVKYIYAVKSDDCFPEAGFEMRVVVNPAITIEIHNNKVEICDGETTDIEIKPDVDEITYVWKVGAFGVEGAEPDRGKFIRQTLHYREAPGGVVYQISAVSDEGGKVCSEEPVVPVRVKALPEISLSWTAPVDKVILGNPIHVQAYPDYYDRYWFDLNGEKSEQKNSDLECYDWNTGEENLVTVAVVSDNGCKNTDSLMFIGPELKLPNVITPNGDGINDRLFNGFELEVFNRNGSRLYKGKDGWNGVYDGQPVPPGTYLYVVHYTTPEGRRIMKKYHVYVSERK